MGTKKVHKIELMVVDLEGVGLEQICEYLENTKYVWPCIASMESAETGEWHDDHPLNKRDTWRKEFRRMFPAIQTGSAKEPSA